MISMCTSQILPLWRHGCVSVYTVLSAGSTSSSLCDHWINRLPGSRPASLASGASSRRTSLASLAESVEFPAERSEDDGETTFKLVLIYRQHAGRSFEALKPDILGESTQRQMSACVAVWSQYKYRFCLTHQNLHVLAW